MPQVSTAPLRRSPFTSHRDPVTGVWRVKFPDAEKISDRYKPSTR